MKQVIAYRMAPVHGPPLGGVGIMLEKGMVFSLEKAKAVGIVHPPVFRFKMISHAGNFRCHRKTPFYRTVMGELFDLGPYRIILKRYITAEIFLTKRRKDARAG